MVPVLVIFGPLFNKHLLNSYDVSDSLLSAKYKDERSVVPRSTGTKDLEYRTIHKWVIVIQFSVSIIEERKIIPARRDTM